MDRQQKRQGEVSKPHLCHALGCKVRVHPRFLMCNPHWRMVPVELQRLLFKHYVRGQEVTKTPTRGYIGAAQACVTAVAIKTGKVKIDESKGPWLIAFDTIRPGDLVGTDQFTRRTRWPLLRVNNLRDLMLVGDRELRAGQDYFKGSVVYVSDLVPAQGQLPLGEQPTSPQLRCQAEFKGEADAES